MNFQYVLFVLSAVSVIANAADLPANHPPLDAKKLNQATQAAAQLTQKGKVVNVINVSPYTYLEVAQDNKTIWIAAPTVAAKKGDTVHFEKGMAMKNFHSKSLNRDFPSITFVNQAVIAKE